jgi:hypothetical protein
MKALVWKRWPLHTESGAGYTEQTTDDSLQGVVIIWQMEGDLLSLTTIT